MDLILAIDDDPNILKIIEQQIISLGYRTIVSTDPVTGITLAKTGGPALILLDIMMPKLDGFGVLKLLQADEFTSRIPVIMLSSKKDRDSVVSAMKLGVADYIVKPCSQPMLGKKIDTALNYCKMKRDNAADEKGSNIIVTRGAGRTVLSFMTSLSDKRFMEDIRAIFHKGFLVMTARDKIVLDLRPLENLENADIPVLQAVFGLFAGKDIYVITGKHYGTLVSAFDFPDKVHLYISPGDMENEIGDD